MEARVIKFRTWDKELQKMSKPFSFNQILNFEDRWFKSLDENINVVLQFTGFLDKENKEIYDGDIFRVEEDGDGLDEEDKIYYLVITWVKEWGMFATLLLEEYHKYLDYGLEALDEPMFWTYTLEDTNSRKYYLCGNIYENKNLLELKTL